MRIPIRLTPGDEIAAKVVRTLATIMAVAWLVSLVLIAGAAYLAGM